MERPKSETSDFGWERAQMQRPHFMPQHFSALIVF
jgi:hypothetical protein